MQATSAPSTLEHSSPFFTPRRLAHANLYVSDYERSAEFYRSIVGIEEVYRKPIDQSSFISNGNTYHDFALVDIRGKRVKAGQRPGLNHFAFEVRNEVELADGYHRALGAGVTFRSARDHDVAHAVYQYDPDGNVVEVYADVVPEWRSIRHGIITKDKPDYVPGRTSEPIREEYFPKDPEIRVVPDALFHARKTSHVALVALDFEGMLDFYTHVIGLSPFVIGVDRTFAVLHGSASDCDLVLYRQARDLQRGLHHIGIQVLDEENLDRAVGQMAERGIELVANIDHPARRVVTIADPDGIKLQFHVDRRWEPELLKSLDTTTALQIL